MFSARAIFKRCGVAVVRSQQTRCVCVAPLPHLQNAMSQFIRNAAARFFTIDVCFVVVIIVGVVVVGAIIIILNSHIIL